MNVAEYIKICFIKKSVKLIEVAEKTGQSKSNLSAKINRNDMKTSEIEKIADALNCDLRLDFIDRDTGKPLV